MTSFSNSGLNKTNITKNTLLWGQILEKAYTESFLNTQLYIALLETNPDCICHTVQNGRVILDKLPSTFDT